MDEVFPVLAGIVVGLVTDRLRPAWVRAAAGAVLGVGLGAMASWISGELAVSWIYLVIDTAQVVGASVMMAGLVAVWRRQRARRPAA